MTDLSFRPEDLRKAFVASLDWWREAGVEEHALDAPGAWLRAPAQEPEETPDAAPSAPAPQPAAPPRRAALSRFLEEESTGAHPGDPAAWPQDLAAFQQWWMESDAVDPPGAFPRVSPSGQAEAPVMLVVDQPEGEELLAPGAATLAANMLRAMGFAPDDAYRASLLPRHTLRPDWPALGKAGYGKLLLHHVALAQPQRMIVCGERVWSLLAHETAQEAKALTIIAAGSARVPVFAAPDLQTLLRNPQARRNVWNRWLDWNDSPR